MGSEYIIIRKDCLNKAKNLNAAYILQTLEFYFSKSKMFNEKRERIVFFTKLNRNRIMEELLLDDIGLESCLDVLEYRGLIEKDYFEDEKGEYLDKPYKIILKE
jgi:hypothetical protein